MSGNETKLVKAVIEFLKLKGHMAWRNNSGAMKGSYKGKRWYVQFSMPGASDVFGVERETGRFIAVECKVGRNKPTDAQEDFLGTVHAYGGIAIVAYSLDDVEDGLTAAKR